MPAVTVRNLSDETHRALKVRAARHGRSTEAEIRDILEAAVRPADRANLGSLLAEIGREAGLTEADVAHFEGLRDATPTEPPDFLDPNSHVILLDTNVVSEPWKPSPDRRVMAWIDAQAIDTLYLSTVTVAGLRFGIAAMPVGKRRETLHRRLEGDVLPVFEGQILGFDLRAAQAYADARAKAKIAGRAIGAADGSIAASP